MNLAESKLKDFESYCLVTIEMHQLSMGGKKYKKKGELSAIARELEANISKALAREKDAELASVKEQIAENLINDYLNKLCVD